MSGARSLLFIVVVLVLATVVPVDAQPSAPPSRPPVEVTGATYAELDDATGIWQLRGNPVLVRRGAVSLRAPAITYETRAQTVRATGGVSYADETLTVQAAELMMWMVEEKLLAAGSVVAEQSGGSGRIRLTAARLEASRKEQRLLATGAVEVRSSDGTLAGDRVEAFGEREELVAEGNARIVHEDIEGQAPRIVLRRRDGVALLSGGAVVRQARNEVRAQTVSVDLRRRRITAAGRATITVQVER